jgi:hypothetical protein
VNVETFQIAWSTQVVRKAFFIHAGWLCAASEALNASLDGSVDANRREIAQQNQKYCAYLKSMTKRLTIVNESNAFAAIFSIRK